MAASGGHWSKGAGGAVFVDRTSPYRITQSSSGQFWVSNKTRRDSAGSSVTVMTASSREEAERWVAAEAKGERTRRRNKEAERRQMMMDDIRMGFYRKIPLSLIADGSLRRTLARLRKQGEDV